MYSEIKNKTTPKPARAPLKIGSTILKNNALLAPMSGVTDVPFRKLAYKLGAGMVVTEMIASQQLAESHPDIQAKAQSSDIAPFVIQLAGREAKWMAAGARVAEGLGADIIDINMGCPAKQVTSGLSGSALMRNLDHALTLIEAVVEAVSVPVTLKMRLGWDEATINAPELAQRAEAAGVQMITVHGRTRCQFYKGKADWQKIAAVKQAVRIPVIANGDAVSFESVLDMLHQSQADGVMIGRGAYGAPWFPGQIADFLAGKRFVKEPSVQEKYAYICEHYEDMLSHYGTYLGVRNARKHLGWYLEKTLESQNDVKYWRAKLCREDDPQCVSDMLSEIYIQRLGVAA